MSFAGGLKPPRIGEPWESWEDDNIVEDFLWGCPARTIALRARRTEPEVVARLAQLGKSFDNQPPRRKMRRVIGT